MIECQTGCAPPYHCRTPDPKVKSALKRNGKSYLQLVPRLFFLCACPQTRRFGSAVSRVILDSIVVSSAQGLVQQIMQTSANAVRRDRASTERRSPPCPNSFSLLSFLHPDEAVPIIFEGDKRNGKTPPTKAKPIEGGVRCARLRNQSGPAAAGFKIMASPLVALHVAADAEGLPAAGMWALERFLAGVRVAVDPQRTRPRECLVAGLTDVPVLRLREGGRRRW